MIDSLADRSNYRVVGGIVALATILVSISFLLQGNIGLGLSDEGYLWYGVNRTLEGDTPMIAFRSYDPGRYYWSATWMLVFGKGIMGLRLAVALFQIVGLIAGLLAARRVVKRWWTLVLVGILLVAWMHPRHKLFEHTVSLIAIYMAVRLIERPTYLRTFQTGVFVGLAAFMGRNHGFYGLASFFLLIIYLWVNQKRDNPLHKRLMAWVGGIAIGYLPMLFMFARVPGLFELYVQEKVLVFFRRGNTNIPLPVPWPWKVSLTDLTTWSGLLRIFTGTYFIILPIFYLTVAAWLWKNRSQQDITRFALLIASSFVGIFYFHHAISRPDIAHLAQGMIPFLLGVVAMLQLPRLQRSWLVAGVSFLLFASTIGSVVRVSPFVQRLKSSEDYVSYNLNGDHLKIPASLANHLDAVIATVAENVGADESVFIAPYSPGLYAVLEKKSPTYNTYLLFSETTKKQEDMLEDLMDNRVSLALLSDRPLGNQEALRLSNTHPLVWDYFMVEFVPIIVSDLLGDQQFYQLRAQE